MMTLGLFFKYFVQVAPLSFVGRWLIFATNPDYFLQQKKKAGSLLTYYGMVKLLPIMFSKSPGELGDAPNLHNG
jgi:hypothetical protein